MNFSIKKLINKITKANQNPNDSFCFMNQQIHCTSGTEDYINVSSGSVFNFSFDFWTKELVIFYIDSEKMKTSLTDSFKKIYKNVSIIDQSN